MKRKTLYLVFGILLLLGGLFGVLLTIASAVTPDLGTGIAIFFGVCSGGFLAPAGLLMYLYWRAGAPPKSPPTPRGGPPGAGGANPPGGPPQGGGNPPEARGPSPPWQCQHCGTIQ